MGKLEQFGENRPPKAEKTPSQEIQEMENNLIGEAGDVFGENHKLVVDSMAGLGPRKANEILEELSKCRIQTKEIIKKFRREKERIFS